MVKIHCSKSINKEAREKIKVSNYALKDQEIVTDFGDDSLDNEQNTYGNRKGIRASSPFLRKFQKDIDDIKKAEEHIQRVDNVFYCRDLAEAMVTQYLSLFPFLSATPLENGLTTNCYVELHWKESRRVFKNIDKRLMWPLLYFTTLNAEYRNKALAMMAMKHVPILKFGRPRVDKLQQNHQPMDCNNFIPAPAKKKQKSNFKQNESFSGSKEMWTPKKDRQRSKESSKRKYITHKTLDYDEVLKHSNLPIESLRVTGSRRLLPSMELDDGKPQEIVLHRGDIVDIQSKHSYVTNDVIDAMLSLLDKKINEDHFNLGPVKVYSVQTTRVVLSPHTTYDHALVIPGKFVTVMPRRYALQAYEDRRENAALGQDAGMEPGSHYTLVSNISCEQGEVNVYETFDPFRTEESLLTEEGKKLIKILTSCEKIPLKVNAVNVKLQEESECGLLACALAVQLCFYAAEENAVYKKVLDVRKTALQCLQMNDLVPFNTSGRMKRSDKETLFTMEI